MRVETRWLRRVGEKALAILARPTAECSAVLVDDATIAALNRASRGVAGPTDVLAFPMTEGRFRNVSPDLLGDVVISTETARRQARAGGGEFRAELALLLIHGILHLVGYDHATAAARRRMWRKQRLILAACDIRASAEVRVARREQPWPQVPVPPGRGRAGVAR
jgi:probable rRNA maturation factor